MTLPPSPPAPGQTAAHPSARPPLDWLRLLIEFVIVVAGISLSFLLQDLREDHAKRAEEQRYLAGFARDFRSDLDLLRARRESLESMVSGLRAAQDLEQRKQLDTDALDRAMDAALTYVGFTPSRATYLELRQTGASSLIQDKELLGEIIDLHETAYALAFEWDRINRNLVLQRMFPYVEEFGPGVTSDVDGVFVSGYHVVLLALEKEQWFRNLLSTNVTFKDLQRTVYGQLVEEIEGVLGRL